MTNQTTATTLLTSPVASRVIERIQYLLDEEQAAQAALATAKDALQAEVLLDDFDVSKILNCEAKLYAVMVERQSLDRVLATAMPDVTWRSAIQEVVRQMTARQLGHQPMSTSIVSNEINLRRHFELTARINHLRAALDYDEDLR